MTTMSDGSPSVASLLAEAAAGGIDRLDAQWLLLHALGHDGHRRAWLIAHDDESIDAASASTFRALCGRRRHGEPLAYLVGEKEFHGLRLQVDARVLVPRPDTETLVDWAIELLRDMATPRVLDLGTGSGAIALAVRQACPHAEVQATDASREALAVAQANSARLGLPIRFVRSEWFEGIEKMESGFALIVSNPPYIADGDPHLPALAHEPASALISGPDGLQDIRRIVEAAPAHLADGGWLLLEHGHDQSAAVRSLLAARGFGQVQSRADLSGIARCAGGRWHAVK